ncbi:unnamed protein product [Closterium sp. NIES-64]|nr:unnamed protein product [Closterium sp. NIES-64]
MVANGHPDRFPTRRELLAAGRHDLVAACLADGGWLSAGWDVGDAGTADAGTGDGVKGDAQKGNTGKGNAGENASGWGITEASGRRGNGREGQPGQRAASQLSSSGQRSQRQVETVDDGVDSESGFWSAMLSPPSPPIPPPSPRRPSPRADSRGKGWAEGGSGEEGATPRGVGGGMGSVSGGGVGRPDGRSAGSVMQGATSGATSGGTSGGRSGAGAGAANWRADVMPGLDTPPQPTSQFYPSACAPAPAPPSARVPAPAPPSARVPASAPARVPAPAPASAPPPAAPPPRPSALGPSYRFTPAAAPPFSSRNSFPEPLSWALEASHEDASSSSEEEEVLSAGEGWSEGEGGSSSEWEEFSSSSEDDSGSDEGRGALGYAAAGSPVDPGASVPSSARGGQERGYGVQGSKRGGDGSRQQDRVRGGEESGSESEGVSDGEGSGGEEGEGRGGREKGASDRGASRARRGGGRRGPAALRQQLQAFSAAAGQAGIMPTQEQLRQAGRGDLAAALRQLAREQAGGGAWRDGEGRAKEGEEGVQWWRKGAEETAVMGMGPGLEMQGIEGMGGMGRVGGGGRGEAVPAAGQRATQGAGGGKGGAMETSGAAMDLSPPSEPGASRGRFRVDLAAEAFGRPRKNPPANQGRAEEAGRGAVQEPGVGLSIGGGGVEGATGKDEGEKGSREEAEEEEKRRRVGDGGVGVGIVLEGRVGEGSVGEGRVGGARVIEGSVGNLDGFDAALSASLANLMAFRKRLEGLEAGAGSIAAVAGTGAGTGAGAGTAAGIASGTAVGTAAGSGAAQEPSQDQITPPSPQAEIAPSSPQSQITPPPPLPQIAVGAQDEVAPSPDGPGVRKRRRRVGRKGSEGEVGRRGSAGMGADGANAPTADSFTGTGAAASVGTDALGGGSAAVDLPGVGTDDEDVSASAAAVLSRLVGAFPPSPSASSSARGSASSAVEVPGTTAGAAAEEDAAREAPAPPPPAAAAAADADKTGRSPTDSQRPSENRPQSKEPSSPPVRKFRLPPPPASPVEPPPAAAFLRRDPDELAGVTGRIRSLEQSLAATRAALRQGREALSRRDAELEQMRSRTMGELLRLTDSLEFRESEMLRTRAELRSTRAEVSALEGRFAAEFRETRRVLEEKDQQLGELQVAYVQLRPTRVVWPNPGNEVLLTGSFNGWTNRIKMVKSNAGVFVTTLHLYPGQYEVKFIVDGNWKVDPRRAIVYTPSGHENNLLVVT